MYGKNVVVVAGGYKGQRGTYVEGTGTGFDIILLDSGKKVYLGINEWTEVSDMGEDTDGPEKLYFVCFMDYDSLEYARSSLSSDDFEGTEEEAEEFIEMLSEKYPGTDFFVKEVM